MPTGTANVFEMIVGGRLTCNEFLSTTACSGGPHIDIYNQNDGSGRQLWLFSFVATNIPLPSGNYYIQSVGTAAQNIPSCGTYMGYGGCGGSTAILSLSNASPTVITWAVTYVSGISYTVRALTLESCSPASPTYLGALPCASGSSQVALASTDAGTGNQVGQPGLGDPASGTDSNDRFGGIRAHILTVMVIYAWPKYTKRSFAACSA